jgi:hypothetical protein
MFKKIGSITIITLATILLGYSATRSLDFIQLTLPPDRAILAYFGLAALDGGLIAWLLSYLYGSRGWQRAISLLMVLVDLVGAVAMFTLDTLYNTGKAGMTTALTADQLQTAVLMLSAVIGLNIAAAVAHHMTNPDQLREQAEEEAFDKVETATLKQISKNADQLAAQLAPTLAADWMQNTRARYMSYVGTGKIPTLLDGTAQDVTPPAYMPLIIPAEPQKPKAQPFDLGALWTGLMGSGKKKKYQSVTVSPSPAVADEPKPTEAKSGGLYDAFKQGIPEMKLRPAPKTKPTEPPPADQSFTDPASNGS